MADEKPTPGPSATPGPGPVADEAPGPKLSQPSEAPNLMRPVPPGSGNSGLTQDEEDTLTKLQAKAAKSAAGDETVDVKVEPDGVEMHYGGYKIGGDWVTVPQTMVGPLANAAADGGVTLIQKES